MRPWLAGCLLACGSHAPAPLPDVTDPVPYVDPTIGTGGIGYAYGSCFVGAAVPHGLAKPAPDTDGPYGTIAFQHFSGYFAQDDRIQGFSSVHLHGTGATDYGILSVMPTLAFDPSKTSVVDYEASFAKSDELAAAGDYTVTLDSGIEVELTATQRVAVERYTLPAAGTLVIDLAKTLSGGTIDAATVTVDDAAQEVTGQIHHLGGMSAGYGGYTLYFAIRASGAWAGHQVWSASAPPSGAAMAQGTGVGAALALPAGATTLAIGLSLVSLDGARTNLAAEVPAIDFDAVASAAAAAWTQQLGVVLLSGGTAAQRRTFYTSLYHAFLMPSVIDDVDGSYVLAGQPVATESGWHQMSDLSLWDTYRTVASLYSWLAPASAHDTARSLIGFAGGLGSYPRWPIAIGESGTMLGASAEIVIADATLRGVADAGGDVAWPVLRAEAMDATAPPGGRGGRDQVEPYMQYGYVPSSIDRSVSVTTEYAHDDFALAQLAGALGDSADHDALLQRSHGWAMLYDPSVGFLRARASDGTFSHAAFDPTAFSGDYAEADAWQSLWMTGNHDPDTLSATLGGDDATTALLEMMFEQSKTDWETSDPSAANVPRPYYWAGNEPDLDAVFVLGQLGDAHHEQQWLRWLVDTMYSDQPEGVPGNDDGGTMGAWYVLATLGLYPVAGSDQWIVGAPRFPKATIAVGGHTLEIVADGLSDAAMYVKSVDLDGVPLDGPYLSQAQLAGASTLHFVMTGK
ncbi:MAG TPA: GH92 family glycosyl hydrolase [Kofleriaceae bacterium]|nr:GH92 family glycosyl hydrolase [Kofleriaceae bacterium]